MKQRAGKVKKDKDEILFWNMTHQDFWNMIIIVIFMLFGYAVPIIMVIWQSK